MSRFFKSAAFPIIIVIVLAFFASRLISGTDRAEPKTFGQFLTQIESKNQIKSVTLDTKDNSVEVVQADDKKYEVGFPDAYGDVLVNQLKASEEAGNIRSFDVKPARSNVILSLLTYVLPFLIFIGFWIFLMNQVQGGGSKVMSFGKSRAKRMSVDSPKITFRDVAGADEAVEELHEIKEFLENPKKFQALGRGSRRACCSTGLRAPARRCWPVPWPARPACRSSRSPARTSSRCSSASAPHACATCSSRPSRTRPASSSWTRSTRSAAIAAPASAAVTTSASRR